MATGPYKESDFSTNIDQTDRRLHVTSGPHSFGVSGTASVLSGISVSTGTAVSLLSENTNRKGLIFQNSSDNRAIWIRFQGASVDNDKKGILLFGTSHSSDSMISFDGPNMYTGEISAVIDTGTASIFITEY